MADQAVPLLKLRARDAEDVQVVSAVLQDALVPVCDMTYRREDQTFVLVAQRLRRESKTVPPERICSAVTFRKVAAVKTHGLDAEDPQGILDLLALMPEEGAAGIGTLTLIFAGDVRVRILSEGDVLVEDFGEAWPVAATPNHGGDAG